MTILNPTKIRGRVVALLVGEGRKTIEKRRLDEVEVGFDGLAGDRHTGLTRPADVRVRRQYEKDTPIRNTRQATVVSQEELAEVAARMGLDELLPEWLGANLVLAGIPDLTQLPGSSRLVFASGAALVVDTENAPCRFPAEVIERHRPGFGDKFVPAAQHKRGIAAWVEREGRIRLGDEVALHLPPLWRWAHAGA